MVLRSIVVCSLMLCSLPFAHPQIGPGSQNPGNTADLVRYLTDEFPLAKREYIEAFESVPRHEFLPERLRSMAYRDIYAPMPTGGVLPSPSALVTVISALSPDPLDRILIIGSEIGYTLSIFSRISSWVFGIELNQAAFDSHAPTIAGLGFRNISYAAATNPRHFEDAGPFDGIVIHSAASRVPESILSQLDDSGVCVIPATSETGVQLLIRVRKRSGSFSLTVIDESFFGPSDTPLF